MRLKLRDLKGLIYESLLLNEKTETIRLSDGVDVPWGCPEHVKDMQTIVAGLQCIRDQYKRGTAARAVFAHACNRLNMMIRRALDSQEPIKAECDDAGSSRGVDGTMHPGSSGYGRGAPAHGRYSVR